MKKYLAYMYPQIASEWHPTKNGGATPFNTTYGVGKKVWWLGKCGHEWEDSPNQRTEKLSGCPYCCGRRTFELNCLAFLNRNLSEDWHPTKNGKLTPFQVTTHCGKKVWWLGKCGHEWEATVDKRSNGTGCPFCSNKKINDSNSFESLNPLAAKQWHNIKNKDLKPSHVAPNCGTKVWWTCENGHEWEARVCDMNSGKIKHRCPIAKFKEIKLPKINIKKRLSLLEIHNKSIMYTHPALFKEWNLLKNIGIDPRKISYGSGKKVWWICENGHEWEAIICNRTGKKESGCPFCTPSKNQRILFEIIKSIFPSDIVEFNYRHTQFRYPDTGRQLELDIYVLTQKIAFEYQGEQHFKAIPYWGGEEKFKKVQEKDRLKKIVCHANDISLLEVPYTWNGDKEYITNLLKEKNV